MGGLFVAPALAATYNTEEVAFVQTLNDYRVAQGVQPLLVSDALSDAADKHNSDMAKYVFVGHTSKASDWFAAGASPLDRMVASGYDFDTSWGENVAAGYNTAETVFEAWAISPGHNANMLGADFKVVGVAFVHAVPSWYDYYWTTDFGGYVDATAHSLGSPSPTTTTTSTTVAPTTTTTAPPVTTTTVTAPAPTTTTPTTPAPPPATPAQQIEAMMDAEFFAPHNSEITGAWVHNIYRWYGIPPHILLAIMGAETSLGDPVLGGRLISEGHYNYGCIRAFANYSVTKWGMLATGTVRVAGKDWLAFPSMEMGMMALGRYLKVGPASNPGYYLRTFRDNRGWPEAVASVYYDRNIPGFWAYVANLKALDAKFCRVAALYGWLW